VPYANTRALSNGMRYDCWVMALTFNTAGPCIPGEHYMLSPATRFARVLELVDQKKYFTIVAGRQTGKTTSLRWLVQQYNAAEKYSAVWVDLQEAREIAEPKRAFTVVLDSFQRAVGRDLKNKLELPSPGQVADLLVIPESAISRYLEIISSRSKHPFVVLIDEADGLIGEAMVSFLTQLRRGYIDRSQTPFPYALALVGMRQVRDYAISTEERRAVSWLGTTSPFNITAESATLRMFTEEEVGELLLQHTQATGQRFEDAAVKHNWYLSQGHPWLVNALAAEVVHRDVMDRSISVTADHVESAKETIIIERRTHIDSLVARLREPRVVRIIAPMLTGDTTADDVLDDDFAYILGMGLIVLRQGVYEISNPVYREVIPRALTHTRQSQLRQNPSWYIKPNGSLDMEKLLTEWQQFWRKDGHLAAEGFGYREAGPHLMLMAFLQRIVNGGGRIEREYGLGRGALDLMVEWKQERHGIEVKLRRDTETEADALQQIARYLDSLGLSEGWLVLFDLRSTLSWKDKLYIRDTDFANKRVHIVGC
jgi:hypothetical protein